MKHILLFILLLGSSLCYSQIFIDDSLMLGYVESGRANKKFMSSGKTKKGIKVGKWKVFEFLDLPIYTEEKDDDVATNFDSYLIESVGAFVDNKKSGVWRLYAIEHVTEKRFLVVEANYSQGLRKGKSIFFYPSGEKASEGNFINDKRSGERTEYFKNGEISANMTFISNKLHGKLRRFYKSGAIKKTMDYIDGEAHGPYTTFYEDGTVKVKMNYVNDLRQGTMTIYYPDGKIQQQSEMQDDKFHGNFKYFYVSGKLWVEKEMKDDKYWNVISLLDSEGNPLDYGDIKDGTGLVKYYTEEGKVYFTRTYKDGEEVSSERFEEKEW